VKVLVCGATGFIGSHLMSRLAAENHEIVGVDLHPVRYANRPVGEIVLGDLRDPTFVTDLFERRFDEVYQLAADMGGAGYIFTGNNDAEVMRNSAAINLNVLNAMKHARVGRLFFSSSACVYPMENQLDPSNPNCSEDSVYPANPDSEYGWEKLFAERLYLAFSRNFGVSVRIARYHNIFGPKGAWNNGKEKAPAALARKVAQAADGGAIDVWGDGNQTRSFLYIDECIEGTIRLMRSDFSGPVNIGSDEMVSIADLARMLIAISGKQIETRFVPGPQGARGRNSDNRLIRRKLGWAPSQSLRSGLEPTYAWIAAQVTSEVSTDSAAGGATA
jgi:GDP-D-mannose 3', 5'-epimerase